MIFVRYTMHLFFGLGSFLTPVFARPFLGNQGKVKNIIEYLNHKKIILAISIFTGHIVDN